MVILLRRAALVAVLCGSLFFLACPHPPPPPPPPAMHGAIITIQQDGHWDHFLVYRGSACSAGMAVIASTKSSVYTDYSGVGNFCYHVRTVFTDGTMADSNFVVAVVVP